MKRIEHTIRSKDALIFRIITMLFLAVFSVFILYPILYILAASVSDAVSVETGRVLLLPKNIHWESYRQALAIPNFWRSYGNSLYYTLLGTAVNMLFTTTAAYALAQKGLPFRRFLIILLVFTMWFDPGIIARFLNFKEYGLLNTRASILIGFVVDTYNLIILRSFFEGMPESLNEAAALDGCNQWQVFTKIYLPLSKSAIATVSLFYIVSRWNGYFWAKILLNNERDMPLQVLLTKLVVQKNTGSEATAMIIGERLTSPQTVIYAVIVLSALPMMVLYPFISKYFKQGVTVGAIKE